MKYPKEYKTYIKEVCKYLRTEFYAGEMEMTVAFSEETKVDNELVAGTIDADLRYLNFRLTVYPPVFEMWKANQKRKIHEVLIHEFCHLLTDPLYDVAYKTLTEKEHEFLTDIRERQTQRITNIILPLFHPLINRKLKNDSRRNTKTKPRRTSR